MRFMLKFCDSDFEKKGWKSPETCFWFEIVPPFEYESDEWWDWDDEHLIEQASDLESEYGIHNAHGSGSSEFGFHSYEVTQDKWEELANKWRDWFVTQNFSPNEIQSLPYKDYSIKFFGYYYDEKGVLHKVQETTNK